MTHISPKDLFRNARSLPVEETRIQAARNELLNAMRQRPFSITHKPANKSFLNPFHSFFSFHPSMLYGFLIAAFLLVGGGSAVAAAQNDLPGDALYGVKIATEHVRDALTLDKTKRVALDAEFAGKRLEEAEALVNKEQDAQPTEHVTEAFTRFDERVTDLRKRLADLKDEDAAAILPGLDQAISQHEAILERLSQHDGSLEDDLNKAEDDVDSVKESLLPKLPEDQAKMRVQNALENAQNESIDLANATEADAEEVKNKLKDAQDLFANGFFREAMVHANDAARLAEKAKKKLEAAADHATKEAGDRAESSTQNAPELKESEEENRIEMKNLDQSGTPTERIRTDDGDRE